MRPARIHARIIRHPFADLLQDARLDSLEEKRGDLLLGVWGLQVISSRLFERDGKIFERVEGRYIPLKIVFYGVTQLTRPVFFTSLDAYPPDDPSRIIAYMYAWCQPGMQDVFHLFGLRGPADADMSFTTRRVTYKTGEGGSSFTFERGWSPSPPMPNRLVPKPMHIHRRYGGDPVALKIGKKLHRRRLFVGGVDIQPEERPDVHAVLNVGEGPSAWMMGESLPPSDRWDNKGEGSDGMSPEVIREEACWVIERLQKNQRVLVHCAAGMNRSTTICCAVLILLEDLSAEEALNRVHEHHPWAKPDSHHWLALRWLAKR